MQTTFYKEFNCNKFQNKVCPCLRPFYKNQGGESLPLATVTSRETQTQKKSDNVFVFRFVVTSATPSPGGIPQAPMLQ